MTQSIFDTMAQVMGEPAGSSVPAGSGKAISFRDPLWDSAEVAASEKTGVPLEVLRSIRVNGERSNSDQVSPVGARGVYQFMPATRDAFLKKYGVDAYSQDPAEQATAAALHLRESYARTNDWGRAAAGYNGGISGENGTNRTRENAEYVRRVMGGVGELPRDGRQDNAAYYSAPKGLAFAEPPVSPPTLGDYAKKAGSSMLRGIGTIGEAAGDAAAFVANKATDTQDYEGFNPLESTSRKIEESMTEGGRAAAADGFKGDVTDPSTWQAPETAYGAVMAGMDALGNIGSFLLPAALTGGWSLASKAANLSKMAKAAAAAGDVAKAAELTKAASAASRAATTHGAVQGASMTYGDAANDAKEFAKQTIGKMSHDELMEQTPIYRDAINSGADETFARNLVVNRAGQMGGLLAAGPGALGGAMANKLLGQVVGRQAAPSILGGAMGNRAVRAGVEGGLVGLAEGAGEVAEKMGSNAGGNIAVGRDFADNIGRDTLPEGVGGFIAGGHTGAVAGAMSPNPIPPPKPQPNPIAEAAAKPNSPLSRAAAVGNPDIAAQAPELDAAPVGAAQDPISARVSEIEAAVGDGGLMDRLRTLGEQNPGLTQQVLGAFATAKNPNAPQALREQSLATLEGALDAIGLDAAGRAGAQWQGLAGEQEGSLSGLRAASIAGQQWQGLSEQPVDNAVDNPTPKTTQEVDNRAPVAPAVAVEEPERPRKTVSAPAVSVKDVAGEDPKLPPAVRQRRAQLSAMVNTGFDVVEQRDGKFFLVNHADNYEMPLENAGDAARATAIINAKVDNEAHQSINSPLNDKNPATEAQIAADNYPKPSVRRFGLAFKTENPAGSTRSGKDAGGQAWSVDMNHHYTGIEGTRSSDGGLVDAFLGGGHRIFVIDQIDPKTGKHDEPKVMAGFRSEEEARKAYLSNYSAGWKGLGAITEMTVPQFRKWVKSSAAALPVSPTIKTSQEVKNDGAGSTQGSDQAGGRVRGDATGLGQDESGRDARQPKDHGAERLSGAIEEQSPSGDVGAGVLDGTGQLSARVGQIALDRSTQVAAKNEPIVAQAAQHPRLRGLKLADPNSPATQALDSLLDVFESLTGHRGIAVNIGGSDGFEYRGNTFIDTGNPYMHVGQTIAHEFKHLTEKYPGLKGLYDRLWGMVDDEAGKEAYFGYLLNSHDDIGASYAGMSLRQAYAAIRPEHAAKLKNEMLADFMGKRFNDRAWLTELGQKKPELFGNFIRDWVKALGEIIGKLAGRKDKMEGVKNVDLYISQLQEAKAVAMEVAEEWAKMHPGYAQRTGVSQAIQAARSADAAFSAKATDGVEIQNHDKWSIYQERSAQVGDGYVRWVEDPDTAYVTDIQTGQKTRGRELLQWLKDTTGKSLYAVGVVDSASEFWDRMGEDGLVDGRTDEDFMSFFGRASFSAKDNDLAEDDYASLQAELDAEMGQAAEPARMPEVEPDVSDAAIRKAGVHAEDAFPPHKWSGGGDQHTLSIKGLYGGNRTVRLAIERISNGAYSTSIEGAWVGPASDESTGYVSLKGAQAFIDRQIAARELRARGYDLASSLPAEQRAAMRNGWEAINAMGDEFGVRKFHLTSELDTSIQDLAKSMGLTEAYKVTSNEEVNDRDNKTLVIAFTDKATGKTQSGTVSMTRIRGKWHTSASTIEFKKGGLGTAFYQLAVEHLARKGLQLSPEATLSGINTYRRTEQMLAAALRIGISNAMVPHPVQRVYGFQNDAQSDAEHAANLERLLIANLRNVRELVPEFDRLRYHPETGAITFKNGRDAENVVDRLIGHRGEKLTTQTDARAFGLGRTTLARALMTQAMLDGKFQEPESFAEPVTYSARDQAAIEYAAVEAQYKGTPQWMMAPNGKPTNLTERQWVQVRTPMFQRWFGPWEKFAGLQGGVWSDDKGEASKVVDENGEPLVVYHGSDNGGFMAFETPGGQRRGDLGIFSTGNYDMADSYVRRNQTREVEAPDPKAAAEDAGVDFYEYQGRASSRQTEDQTLYGYHTPYGDEVDGFTSQDDAIRDAAFEYAELDKPGSQPGIYALFVNLRNPSEFDFEGATWSGSREHQWVVEVAGEIQADHNGTQYFDTKEEAADFAQIFVADDEGADPYDYVRGADDHYQSTDDAVREAWSFGNDGAIIRNVIDDGGGPGSYMGEPSDVFVARHGGQLKSANWNTGEFGTSTDDLRFSKKGFEGLNPQVAQEVQGVEAVAKFLTPAERSKLRKDTARKMMDIYAVLPSVDDMVAAAYAGKAKRGWYRHSHEALQHIFGKDAWRVAALMAATSPQNTVEFNAQNTLNIWKNWTAAGRPTSRKEILRIMGQSVVGDRGEDSVLEAWIGNTVRALTADSPSLVLSGPKVDSFMRNLSGDLSAVTNDAWMANYALIDQILFAGGINKAGTEPGKRAGYLAMTAATRAAAKKLGWQPAEVQETVWSWAMSMLEMMDARGESRGAIELLDAGALSDEVIGRTPDFRSLFHREPYAGILREAGYGKQLDSLAAPTRHEDNGPPPFNEAKTRKLLIQAGLRLEFLQRQRRTNVQISWEARPGESTGILPGMHAAPLELQQQYMADVFAAIEAADFKDKAGLSLRQTLFGPSAWQGKVLAGAQTQMKPGVVADNHGSVRVDDASRDKIAAVSSVLGLVLNQEGVYWHWPIYKGGKPEQENGVEIDYGRSLTNPEMSALYAAISKRAGHSMWAPANTPTGVRVLNFSDTPNKEFHKVIRGAADWFAKKHNVESATRTFSSDGDAIENNWKDHPNGQEYLARISEAGRSDLLGWANGELQAAVDAVNRRYSEQHGWGAPTRADVQRSARDNASAGRGGHLGEAGSDLQWSAQASVAAGQDQRAASQRTDRALRVQGAVHFGKAPGLSVLSGSASGTGIKGAEQERLNQAGVDPRLKRRVYFYLPVDGGIPQPEIGLGAHVYKADLGNLYDLAEGKIRGEGNPFELAVLNAGYDGYINREQGTAVLLNRDAPVSYEGRSYDHKLIQRRIERVIPKTVTRQSGDELVRRPDASELGGVIRNRSEIKAAAPSFRMEFGEARVKADEAPAADGALEKAGSAFRFGEVSMSARDPLNDYLASRNKTLTTVTPRSVLEADIDLATKALEAAVAEIKAGNYRQMSVPIGPVPHVLRMLTAPTQMMKADASIVRKVLVDKHADDFKDVSAKEFVMSMYRPAMVLAGEVGGEYELVSSLTTDGGPVVFAIKQDAQSDGGPRVSVVKSAYARPVAGDGKTIAKRILSGRLLYADMLTAQSAITGQKNESQSLWTGFENSETLPMGSTQDRRDAVQLPQDPISARSMPEREAGVNGQKEESQSLWTGFENSEALGEGSTTGGHNSARLPQSTASGQIVQTANHLVNPRNARYARWRVVSSKILGDIAAKKIKTDVDLIGWIGRHYKGDIADVPSFSARSPIGFYSELSEQIEKSTMRQAPAAAWKTFIKALSQKGVKPDEVEWTGVTDWLDLQEGKVSKDALLDYLSANGVQVQEVQSPVGESIGTSDFSQWQLKGGENYREVLLTLPQPSTERTPAEERRLAYLERNGYGDQNDPTVGDELKAEVAALRAKNTASEPYTSAHWNQKNVLAHIRVNDRVDADGAKVLFVEELQSDWQQEARKYGFKKDDSVAKKLKADLAKAEQAKRDSETRVGVLEDLLTKPLFLNGSKEDQQRILGRLAEARDEHFGVAVPGVMAARAAVQDAEFSAANAVPVAPFVDKTDKWLNLALKRVITMAVDGGYDKVAFVNGKQSADRYDLSKQIKQIDTAKMGGDYYMVIATDQAGKTVIDKAIAKDALPDVLGKDLAEKIIKDGGGTYSGLDLKVGGEGMKTFYDAIVPNAIKALAKKLGGEVGDVVFGGERADGRFVVFDDDSGERLFRTDNRKEASEYLLSYPGDASIKEVDGDAGAGFAGEQPGVTITTAMREKAGAGLPLFSARDQVDTPEFKKWFGDSVVVDESGAPLRVFTGTSKDVDFKAFKVPKNGVWFTTDPVSASQYAVENDSMDIKTKDYRTFEHVNTASRVIPAYLRIEKPYTLTQAESDQIRYAQNYRREQGKLFDSVRARGFDGIDMGGGTWVVLNDPAQIKSSVGNNGNFDASNKDISRSARDAAWTDERIDRLMSRYAYTMDDNRTKAYAAWVRPQDFLDATTPADFKGKLESEKSALDKGQLMREVQEIQLISRDHPKSGGVFKTDGHEGRHRMMALRDAGVERAPVTLTIPTKNGAEPLTSVFVSAQKWSGVSNAQSGFTIERMIPISWAHHDELKVEFGGEGEVSFSAKDQIETPQFKRWFGDSKVVDADGKPLVVYHGTGAKFTVFKPSKQGTYGKGIYFTNMRSSAEEFGVFDGGEHRVVDVYVSLQNPWRPKAEFDSEAAFSEDVDSPIVEAVLSLPGGRKLLDDAKASGQMDFGHFGVDLQRALKKLGYDGIIADYGDGSQEIVAFDPTQVKSATNNNGQFDPTNPDINHSAKDGWSAPEPSRFDDFLYKAQDKHIDTKRVIESIRKVGAEISDDLDVYLQEELFHGRAAKRTKDFGEFELEPVLHKMAGHDLTMGDVEEYLHARHAEEANRIIAERNPDNPDLQDGGSGMETAVARRYLDGLSADQRAKLEDVAADVDSIISRTRQLYADYGLESQAKVDGWASMFQHYIPLYREDKDGGMGVGQGISVKGKEVKGRTGSKRRVVDIIANIAMQREKVIVRGEKNRVAKALVGLAGANPNADFWHVGQPEMERVYDPATNTVVERPDPMFKSRPNVVVAKLQYGDEVREVAVVFNEDNERAVRMASALKNLDAGNLEGLLGISAKITRYFAAVNTQYNPVFGVVNLIRDVQGALLNLGETPLANDRLRISKDTMSALRGIYSDIRAARRGEQPDSEWAHLWNEFQEHGGQTGYRDLFRTSADRADALKKILNPDAWADSKLGQIFTANGQLKVPMGQAKKGAGWIFDWLSDYNEAMENGVRLASYKAALDRGMSKEQAASLAKNLTVNFNRKGQIGQQAGAVYAFFNAAMQGTARIGKTLFDMDGGDLKTLRLSKTGKTVVYGGVLVGVAQALALAAAGFGEDDPPEFVRERSLVIPTGGKSYITIPMPLGFHVIPGLGRHATEFALSGFKRPAHRAISVFGMFADSFNPIGNAGMSIQTIAPTALDPLVALTENRDWTGKPIARISSNKALPGHTQWKDSASTLGKMTSEAINWLSGGNQYVAGAISPTPDQIDYLLGQLTGGVGREASKVEQTALGALRGEEIAPHKLPLLGRFYGNARSQASEGGSFYANANRLNELETEVKGLQKDGKYAEAMELLRSRPDAYLMAQINVAERQIQRLRREKRALIEQGAGRAQIRAKEEQVTEAMARINRAVERATEAAH